MTKPPPIPKLKQSKTNWLLILSIAASVLVVTGLVCLRLFVIQPFKVPTSAMSPTLRGIEQLPDGSATFGDHIFVDKLSYRFRAPKRGETVVFRTDSIKDIPYNLQGLYYVKRIVGLPGERVSIKPPHVCINGVPVVEPPILEKIQSAKDGYHGYVLPGTTASMAKFLASENDSVLLGDDEYFVLGDNSRASLDSRYWGPVRRDAIVGRVTSIYWPLGRAGKVE